MFGVRSYDLLIYEVVVLGVGLLTNFVPASRAARLDPTRARHSNSIVLVVMVSASRRPSGRVVWYFQNVDWRSRNGSCLSSGGKVCALERLI
jgi:hypothetical protein